MAPGQLRPRRPHCRAPHLGIRAHPPSPRAHDRAGRRHVARRDALDRLPARLLPARAGAVAPFRRLFLDGLMALHAAGRLAFFGKAAGLAAPDAFAAHLAPLRKAECVVYAKRPFGGPEAVLAYLSRYTHRVAISNSGADHAVVAGSAASNGARSNGNPKPWWRPVIRGIAFGNG